MNAKVGLRQLRIFVAPAAATQVDITPGEAYLGGNNVKKWIGGISQDEEEDHMAEFANIFH